MPGEDEKATAIKNMQIAYKHGGVPTETASFYDKWAADDKYELHLNKDLYKGPAIVSKTVDDYFSNADRDSVRILDVAAGTGFVAEYLKEHGFHNIDALDPSEGMLEKAREKKLYNHYMMAYIDDKPLPTLPNTYDCAVCSGGMGEGHIPYYGMDQLIRVVKPGGLITIVMREEFLKHSQYADKLEPHMALKVKEGKWERIARTIVPGYSVGLNGLVFQYKVL